jgi:catechol 2,3-dioxygenase-like lactoylglutathione lyase family enzyme
MSTVSVRYIVDDIDAAIAFYADQLDFEVQMHPGPGFAALTRGDLRLLLNTPAGGGGAGQAMPDGSQPRPGGWNRIQIEVHEIEPAVARMRAAGITFRNEIVTGRGGRQILADDPSGNPVELFQPASR